MTASDDPELEDADDVLEIEYEEPDEAAARQQRKRPGRFRRFVRGVFSHLVFAGIVLGVASFFGYMNNQKIMRDVGDRVCAENMFGGYLSKANKTTVAAAPPATPMTTAAAPATPPTANKSTPKASRTMAMPAGKLPPSAAPAATTIPTSSEGRHAANPNKSNGSGDEASTPAAVPAQPIGKTANSPRQPQDKTIAGKPAMTAPPAARPPKTAPRPTPTTKTQQLAAIRGAASRRPPANAPAATAARQGATAPSRNAGQQRFSANRPLANPPARAGRPSPARPVIRPPAAGGSKSAKRVTLASALQQARQAQASGKAGADKIYKQLIRQYPNSPDLPGELGNIYYWQGKLAEAAEQYYETAQRLIRRNQSAQAACLLPVLKRLDPARASALSRQTSQACPSARRQ